VFLVDCLDGWVGYDEWDWVGGVEYEDVVVFGYC